MDKARMKLNAQARKAGIKGYGSMTVSELQEALAGGKSSKRKSASAIAKPERKQTGRKPRRKSSKPRGIQVVADDNMTEAQAKRIVKKYDGKRGRRPAEYYEAQAVLGSEAPQSKRKRKPANTSRSKPKARASSNGIAGRNLIDNSKIDWKAPWDGGKSGVRKVVFAALKRFNGNKDKVFSHLEPEARSLFKQSNKTGEKYSKDQALALLRWYIGRTAFDFVMGTNQHQKSTNRKNVARSSARKSSVPKRKTTAASDNGVAEMSDAKLKRIVKASAGKRGRKSAETLAAVAELQRREKPARAKAGRKSTPSTRKPQTASQGRRGSSTRRRTTKPRVKA